MSASSAAGAAGAAGPAAERVRTAVVGLGRMGSIHAANLARRCPSVELVCVVDASEEAARRVGEQLGVAWSTSADDAITAPGVEAVVVATPTASHGELAVAAAEAGKHVFSEKPISLDRAETVRVVERVAATGVTFQVGFHRRFDPDWAEVVDRVRAGELGVPYLFRSSLRDMAPPPVRFLAGSGGFFTDMALHDLDVARWMVGEVVRVTAIGSGLSDPGFAEIGDVDTAVVTLVFESGALGVIDGSRAAGYGYESSTELMGSLATARIDAPHHRRYEWRTPGLASHDLPRDFEQRYPQAYAAELEAFARAARAGLPGAVSGLDALAAFDLAQAADRSWRTGLPVDVTARRVEGGVVYDTAP